MNIAATADVVAQTDWPNTIYRTLRSFGVSQVSYVPDAGHSRLIELSHRDSRDPDHRPDHGRGRRGARRRRLARRSTRAALLMQSSGVGNCVNMLSLMASCRIPLLTLVTMRGEWAEFNPWQIPMGKATPQAFEIMGVTVLRLERPEDAEEVVSAACSLAFDGDQQIAILISQRMLGRKKWTENK